VRLVPETKAFDLTEDSPLKPKSRPKAYNSPAAASPVGFDVDDYNDFDIHLGMEESLREPNTPTPAVKRNLPPMDEPPKTPRGVAKRPPPPPSSAYCSSRSTTSTSTSCTFASPALTVTLDTPSGPLYKSPPSSAPSMTPHSSTSREDQRLLVPPAADVRLVAETKAFQSVVVVVDNNSIRRKTYAKAQRQSLDTCGSNSPPLFTSPSTTGGGFLSSQSTLDDESAAKTIDHRKNNKNTSIVVIDDDSEDDVTPASRNDDLRVRLAKRLKGETIEIDD
jgi:hypothetical protein